jgi:pyruvate/2-oxoglutarate dehydrogenase complex dihydrolipoamide dehydrogenase (E3) component
MGNTYDLVVLGAGPAGESAGELAAYFGPDRRVSIISAEGKQHDLLSKNILVATGPRPYHPTGIRFEDPYIWDSEEFFSPGRHLPSWAATDDVVRIFYPCFGCAANFFLHHFM